MKLIATLMVAIFGLVGVSLAGEAAAPGGSPSTKTKVETKGDLKDAKGDLKDAKGEKKAKKRKSKKDKKVKKEETKREEKKGEEKKETPPAK